MEFINNEEELTSLYRKLTPPLVTLLSGAPETQFLALRSAELILERRPEILRKDVKVFFCKYNDPLYVKVSKLEIIHKLATLDNLERILEELRESGNNLRENLANSTGMLPRLILYLFANQYEPLVGLQSILTLLQLNALMF